MAFDSLTMAQEIAYFETFGNSNTICQTPYQKQTSDNIGYANWYEASNKNLSAYNSNYSTKSLPKQSNTLTEISLIANFKLFFEYFKSLQNIGMQQNSLAFEVFLKTIHFLLDKGVDKEQISIINTMDESILVKASSGVNSFHFEIFFDSIEYTIGYEVISNVFANNNIISSSAGSIDYVLENNRV